ncbi:hypothetical protein Pth03_41540 [Planotetraspora thailandica]|uniref:DUF695 domain-containing protein n=1 Tax=Planotetraspora thailandica TaxID=487172 RepID=A0A8J3V449_9ACTN|nr:DUF695 domain-containing protein [Planotetraspora thailandica]GII55765.1 hypothetical protein Pth03_41540 [Planotetraspora thailandica]
MRLFGRKNEPVDPAEAISDFWTWWRQTRPEIDAYIEAEDTQALAELIGGAVTTLHPSLIWEIAPGGTARHALVVSASGDPELRPLAHRWAKAAPPTDDLWEFHPSRQANPKAAEVTVEVAGREFGVDRLVLGLRVPPGAARVDVSAFHPIFPDIDDETRLEATLLALDWLLGEDEVARWVGDIIAAEFEPIDAIPAIHLSAVVADIAEGVKPGQWALLEGQTGQGARLTVVARHPLRPVDFPTFDQHIAISLPYANAQEDGQPAGPSMKALRDFEERLGELLGKRGSAVLAAHLTSGGTREMHVYADPSGDAALVIKELVPSWPEGRARVDVAADPSWSAVAHFLT